jgi:hypothetical protein
MNELESENPAEFTDTFHGFLFCARTDDAPDGSPRKQVVNDGLRVVITPTTQLWLF